MRSLSHSTADGTDILRFVVAVDDGHVVAFVSTTTCQSHRAWRDGRQTLDLFFQEHRGQFDAIVAQRVRAGSRHPVVVRAGDL
jgi:hypothetical protein